MNPFEEPDADEPDPDPLWASELPLDPDPLCASELAPDPPDAASPDPDADPLDEPIPWYILEATQAVQASLSVHFCIFIPHGLL